MATATAEKNVEAKPRQGGGKNDARRLRTTGMIPAVVYGAGQDSQAIAVDPKQMNRILRSESGHNSIFDLSLGGQTAKVMIVDWQYEPIKGNLIHIDLKRIALDKVMRVEVPIQLVGVPVGVKTQGGILDQVLREVEVECLPGDIPSHIDVDVTGLGFGDVLRVADLPHSDKLKFLSDEDTTVAHVVSIKEEAAPAVDALAAATPAEPEVVKKGKTETADAAAPEKGAKK
jgi:large subunit ribosomal protein L25